MDKLHPIHYKKFEKFLTHIGCHLLRKEGDHRMWGRSDLIRPIVVRTKKDLPIFEIKSNLRTLHITNQDYLNIIHQL
ncbi:MAG: type II toxin-antitoxin system HicA family toxin [Chlamydiae bacterium]|nr:type II toxin-antitoxin system HicA family toxin [Chlamydiota bacterium]